MMRLFALGLLLVVPTLLTAAEPLTRIAFGSCADQNKPQPIWKSIFATKPELFLFMGDNIYADIPGSPATPTAIKQSYDQAMKQEGYQKLFTTCPVMACWDDHDYGVNDGGADYPHKKESQKLLLDWLAEPEDSPRRQMEGVYHSKIFGPEGKRVQVIMLDTRYFRSPLKKGPFIPNVGAYIPNTDDGMTMLGDAQWKWLEEQLLMPAEIRLLVSTVQLISEDHQFERWANFPKERDRLFALLRKTKANGVIVLSGDRHLADLSMMSEPLGYPLYDVTSSGLNQGFKGWRAPERNRHRVSSMAFGDNFGLITIDWKTDPRINIQLRDVDGEIIVQQRIALSLLKAGSVSPEGGPEPLNPMVIEGVLTPAQAAEKVNAKCTIRMKVMSTGESRDNDLIYLNSEPNFRNVGNFTVVVPKSLFKDATKETYLQKTIQFTGVVQKSQNAPRVTLKAVGDLKIVNPE